MKIKKIFYLSLISLCLVSAPLYAQEAIAIIVSKKNPVQNLTPTEVTQFFSGAQATWKDGNKVFVVTRKANLKIKKEFENRLFGGRYTASKPDFKTYSIGSEEGMKNFIANTPEAIGYMYKKNVDSSVKAVLILK